MWDFGGLFLLVFLYIPGFRGDVLILGMERSETGLAVGAKVVGVST